jgi:subfamily B ATP-binding cassette protein MsbA
VGQAAQGSTEARTEASAARKPLTFDAAQRGLLRRVLADWVWPRWRPLAGTLLLMVGLAGVSACYPALVGLAVDGSKEGRFDHMYVIAGLIILATSARAVLLYLTAVASNRIVLGITLEMQKRATAHLLRADFAQLTRNAPGELISRLTNDVDRVQIAFQAALNTALRDGLMIVALVGVMVWKSPLLSLIVLAAYPVAILPIMTIGKRLKRVARATQQELASMLTLLSEQLGSARLVKTFRLEDYAAGRMIGSFEQIMKLRMKAVRNRARLDPMLEALAGFAIAAVIALATWRITSGATTIGDFVGFIMALGMAAQPTRGIGNLSVRVQEGLAAAERFYALLDERPTVVDRPTAKPLAIASGGIAFDHVSFAYDGHGQAPAVRDFSLTIPGGRTLALVGRSGSGKSTVINLVPRLFDVTGGSIRIDGQDLRDVTLASLRDQIAMVSQDVTLFDDTIRANIALGRLGADDGAIVAAAKAAAAHDFIMEQPRGYDTPIGDRGSRLSGGQRQRLALARAILKDAPILLLDEATSALDTESERLVQAALARFTRGRTTLVIAHRLSTVQSADLICVMDDGRLAELGTHHQLLAQGGLYAKLAATQLVASEAAQ